MVNLVDFMRILIKFNKNLEPVFVASLSIGDYVYFFIRESALEYMNFGGVLFIKKINYLNLIFV